MVPHPVLSLLVVVLAGAVPQPAGSLAAAGVSSTPAAATEDVAASVEVEPPVASRFRNAVMSLPDGTMATTSQPSPDFSVSFAASEAAS